MKRLDRRLAQVATASHRQQQVTVRRRYDVSHLTPREQYELALLLDRVKPSIPHEDWSQVSLTPDEQRRLEALVERVRIVKPGAR
jgi:hypothetical protein